jgi:acyl carrier protein
MRKVYQTVSQIMADIIGSPSDLIAPDTDLSSLRYQEKAAAAIACERSFRIEMEDERIDGLKTLENWADYIRERIADKEDGRPAATDRERESWYYQ